MLADGLAQYLVWKRWQSWFLVVGTGPDDQLFAEALRRAASRFNAHVYMANAGARVGEQRKEFLDYMSNMYRRMLNEHLDGLGAERGVDVGESELAPEYAAAGFKAPGVPVDTGDKA